MEVKLIAMTDAVRPELKNEFVDSFCSAEHVCDHAARTCTSTDLEPMVTEEDTYLFWQNEDYKALKGALASGHTSVIEHAVYTFEIKGVSRALTHQLVRHRIASYSQQSQRYVDMEDFDYIIPKSMSDKVIGKTLNPITLQPMDVTLEMEYMAIIENLQKAYKRLIEKGVPEEDARYILPNATCTNIIVTMNARELIAFFKYRVCNRAQWEIRMLARKMLKICKEVSPIIFAHAGANCEVLGYCPEKRSCGKCPRLIDLKDKGLEDGLS